MRILKVSLTEEMQRTLPTFFYTLLLNLVVCGSAFGQTAASINNSKQPTRPSPEVMAAELKLCKEQVKAKPEDAQLHLKIAELERGLGNKNNALEEYVKTTELDPTAYMAFHQIAMLSNDQKQLDQSIEKLNKLILEKPKELMLRVALSELIEKRGNYYQAARTLIDITYANAVPEKYKNKVNARIHFLLTQQKKAQQQESQETASNNEEELDVVPAPLPVQTNKRSIASAKIKDSKEVKGMGNVPLLP